MAEVQCVPEKDLPEWAQQKPRDAPPSEVIMFILKICLYSRIFWLLCCIAMCSLRNYIHIILSSTSICVAILYSFTF